MSTKITLEELIDRVGAHDDMAMSRTEAGRIAYCKVIGDIMADAGWDIDEYELALADRIGELRAKGL